MVIVTWVLKQSSTCWENKSSTYLVAEMDSCPPLFWSHSSLEEKPPSQEDTSRALPLSNDPRNWRESSWQGLGKMRTSEEIKTEMETLPFLKCHAESIMHLWVNYAFVSQLQKRKQMSFKTSNTQCWKGLQFRRTIILKNGFRSNEKLRLPKCLLGIKLKMSKLILFAA